MKENEQREVNVDGVSATLKNNKNVVSVAVEKDGLAIKFASEEVRNDKEVVMAAVNGHKESEIDSTAKEMERDR